MLNVTEILLSPEISLSDFLRIFDMVDAGRDYDRAPSAERLISLIVTARIASMGASLTEPQAATLRAIHDAARATYLDSLTGPAALADVAARRISRTA